MWYTLYNHTYYALMKENSNCQSIFQINEIKINIKYFMRLLHEPIKSYAIFVFYIIFHVNDLKLPLCVIIYNVSALP